MTIKTLLLLALAAVALFYLAVWIRAILRERAENQPIAPSPTQIAIGAIANFFDTFGIGSFATTTAMWRNLKMIRDEWLPGTLNVGHTLPTVAQAFIFIQTVEVDIRTLLALIVAAVLGMTIGAKYVATWPRRRVQYGMSIALFIAACLFIREIYLTYTQQGTPTSGALALTGGLLVLGFLGNFVLGALMSLGIGLYGPCMIMISLLGMNPKAAFPIMMGSCAFLMPMGSTQYIKQKGYDLRAALGLALGGIPAVLAAVYIVKEMEVKYVRWIVVAVVLYTAISLLRSALKDKREA
ncbi:MAG: sulfite exporter TauE/SafE family protein [Acidobacteria bacterium]|nr:sulfite exporter TauE/SafE family protein [Acidobacteriota bacterium]